MFFDLFEGIGKFLMGLIGFLNANQGAFLVAFSAIVAYSTWRYAVLTGSLVRETTRMRRAETEPSLAVYLMPEKQWVNLIDVVVRNFGPGPAYDIKWRIEPGDEESKNRYARLYDVALFRGLSYLPPGEEFRSYMGSGVDLLKEPPAKPLKIMATYKNAEGESQEKSFVLDIEQYRNLSQSTPPEYEIASTLKSLQEDVSRALTGYLKVATVTEKEHEKNIQESIEKLREMRSKHSSEGAGSGNP